MGTREEEELGAKGIGNKFKKIITKCFPNLKKDPSIGSLQDNKQT
jgi:hypothetical protein